MFAWHNKQFDCASWKSFYSQRNSRKKKFSERDKLVWKSLFLLLQCVLFEKCASKIENCVPCAVCLCMCSPSFLSTRLASGFWNVKDQLMLNAMTWRLQNYEKKKNCILCNWASFVQYGMSPTHVWDGDGHFFFFSHSGKFLVHFPSRSLAYIFGEKATKFYFGKKSFCDAHF